MDVDNLYHVREKLKEFENLRKEEEKLKNECDYLPGEYNDDEIKKQIDLLDDEISKREKIKKDLEKINELGKLDNNGDISYDSLDKIILEFENLILKRESFEKYKKLHDRMQLIITEAVISVTDARDDIFSKAFSDSIDSSTSIETFINTECLRSSKINKPFMVALLTMDPNEIYSEVINGAKSLNNEQKKMIAYYINRQKNRINHNLILSDRALIDLLESNTGKNIMTSEQINDRYKFYCDRFCYRIFKKTLREIVVVGKSSSDDIINAFEFIPEYQYLSDNEKILIKKRIEYEFSKSPAELQQEIDMENRRILMSPDGKNKKYDILTEAKDKLTGVKKYTFNGKIIKRFSEQQKGPIHFLRTIDDMRIANFPIGDCEDYIFEAFSSKKVSDDYRQHLIAIVLDNLKLCYDLFNSYYKDNSMNITTYLNMSSGDVIELDYSLGEANHPHILGIPPTNKYDENTKKFSGTPQLPRETLDFLGIYNASALNVLERILEKRDDIIKNCGCVKGADGVLYEMLPWEKIILKTNAFIRGDFFKTTSYISGINPYSYMFSPSFDKNGKLKQDVNAVSLNSTLFNRSAINQPPTNIFENSPLVKGEPFIRRFNTRLERDKDYILKGLIAKYKNDRISRIEAVKTNESFMGQRIITADGQPVRSLNKMLYMLQNVNPEQGGVITSVENPLGHREYSIDEMILLLEDMALSFENSDHVHDMVNVVVKQLSSLNDSLNNSKKPK